jgi:hypothetical protein
MVKPYEGVSKYMYVLDNSKFSDTITNNISEFVTSWGKFYKYSVKQFEADVLIDYESELNLGKDLTRLNLEQLLRWKDPKYLSPKILSGPNKSQSNPRVAKIVAMLPQINAFRSSQINEAAILSALSEKFTSGATIWAAFCLHIAKPLEYPIADQHVYRVFNLLEKNKQTSWEKYFGYKKFFDRLFSHYRPHVRHIPEVTARKHLDDSLLAYGQFLKRYNR